MTTHTSLTQCTLHKSERLTGRTLIEKLFAGGRSRSVVAFPLRVVYMKIGVAGDAAPVSIMVSVPKRCFKRAVKRNRVKRQVREAFRLNKHLLNDAVDAAQGTGLALAFIWLDDTLHDSDEVHRKVKTLLARVAEKCTKEAVEEQQATEEIPMKSAKIEGE